MSEGLVCLPVGNHAHLPLIQLDYSVLELISRGTLQHNEGLIGISVIVPCELTFGLHQLELVVIHFSNDFR